MSLFFTKRSYDRSRSPVTGLIGCVVDLVLPNPCLACGGRSACLPAPLASASLGLCLQCRSELDLAGWGRCLRCGKEVEALAGRRDRSCGDCLRRPPPIESLFFLYDYGHPIDTVIHALKFRRLEGLARPLADQLFDRFSDQLTGFDLLVPIPLHRVRRWRRGYNQALSLARPLARRLGLPCEQPLKHRAGRPQSELDLRARTANARHLLQLKRDTQLRGRSALLVDDVVTTGSTLHAAARLLHRAGAKGVSAIVVARTPRR